RPTMMLREMLDGYRVTQAIHVAAVLGLADLLARDIRTSDELATLTKTDPVALYRLMRALAAAGIFHEHDGERFSLTQVGDCLRRDAPESAYGWARFVGSDYHWKVWRGLEYSVRTGETASRHMLGTDVWTYRQQHPEVGEEFDLAMESNSNHLMTTLLPAFDFGEFRTIVDVGGGTGIFLAAILSRYPDSRGVLFDQPQVVAGARPLLERAGVADRCEIVGGDFFQGVPERGDAYVLKSILHDWNDEDALAILRTCRRAMADGAALLLIERDLGEPNDKLETKLSDLNMLTGPGGRERSQRDYAALLAGAGFAWIGFTPSESSFGIYLGVAA
ncbi:MAG TPA: methyltransferase, partial [Thermomicrobiales bacterium]|nr:methyltransferase [Thermomicrobiales bacterium]